MTGMQHGVETRKAFGLAAEAACCRLPGGQRLHDYRPQLAHSRRGAGYRGAPRRVAGFCRSPGAGTGKPSAPLRSR